VFHISSMRAEVRSRVAAPLTGRIGPGEGEREAGGASVTGGRVINREGGEGSRLGVGAGRRVETRGGRWPLT
jgi:hypothetical protein